MDPRPNRHALATVFQGARAGDPRAFRALIEALAPDLVRFITFLLRGDRESAHDVVQDVFVRAWRALPTLDDADHLRRWTFRVARCKAASHLRSPGARLRRHAPLPCDRMGGELLAGRSAPVPESVRERPPVYAALREALYRLPPDYGAAIELHYLQGYALRDTAELLGVTLPTVKMRLVRARASLRRLLAPGLAPRVGAPRPAPPPHPEDPMDHAAERRRAPAAALLSPRVLRLAAAERRPPMDPDLPDRVLTALGLSAAPAAPPSRRSRRTLVALVGAALLLMLLPPRPAGPARWAAATGTRTGAPPAAPAAPAGAPRAR